MSLLRPERIHAILSPGQLVLARRVDDCEAFPLQGDSGDVEAVLRALELGLDKFPMRENRLSLMLADTYARCSLTAPVDTLLSVEEEGVLARQAFRERYGDVAQEWTIRYQPQDLGQPFMACAAETGLITGIQAICEKYEMRVDGIQPMLARVHAQVARSPHARTGWLAIVEPGWLHLALLQDRAWMQLASTRSFGSWAEDLNTLLHREATLHGQAHDAPLWLVSAVPGLTVPAQYSTWRLLPGLPAKSNLPYVDLVLGMQ